MHRLISFALFVALMFAPAPLRAEAQTDVVVAVDPGFAAVAQVLTASFTARTGYELRLSLMEGGTLPEGVDIVLAADAALPQRLAQEGLADPASQVTYAMGATGSDEATAPRDAILMHVGAQKPAAQEFMAFLMTSDAWDLIVTHGHGAY